MSVQFGVPPFNLVGLSSAMHAMSEAFDDVLKTSGLKEKVNQLSCGYFSKATVYLPHVSVGLFAYGVANSAAGLASKCVTNVSSYFKKAATEEKKTDAAAVKEAAPAKTEEAPVKEASMNMQDVLGNTANTVKVLGLDLPATGAFEAAEAAGLAGAKQAGAFLLKNASPFVVAAQSFGVASQAVGVANTEVNSETDRCKLMLRTAALVCSVAALGFTITGLLVEGAALAVAAGAVFAAASVVLSLAENFLADPSTTEANEAAELDAKADAAAAAGLKAAIKAVEPLTAPVVKANADDKTGAPAPQAPVADDKTGAPAPQADAKNVA